MRKKIFMIFIFILIISCSNINAASYIETVKPGLWNIYGSGFAEKSFVRISFELTGDMNLRMQSVDELSDDITTLIQDGEEISRTSVSGDFIVITSYDINLRLDATLAGIKVWNENLPNGIKIPVLLPKKIPTDDYPFVLPSITVNELNYTLTFTSETSGKLRIKGYTNIESVGKCEINADSAVWKSGTQTPSTEQETKSGCDIFNLKFILFALIILGGVKFVRN